jgi:hypothetical protein
MYRQRFRAAREPNCSERAPTASRTTVTRASMDPDLARPPWRSCERYVGCFEALRITRGKVMRKCNNWVLVGALALVLTAPSIAAASEPTQPEAPAAPVSTTTTTAASLDVNEPTVEPKTTQTTFFNKPLFLTGAALLGASYGTSAIVAATNDRKEDKKLYYPVAGPWMDLANRDCRARPCSNENLSKLMLVANGVVQGVGALGVVSSIFVPERTTRDWWLIGNERLHVAPAEVGDLGVGLRAGGTF